MWPDIWVKRRPSFKKWPKRIAKYGDALGHSSNYIKSADFGQKKRKCYESFEILALKSSPNGNNVPNLVTLRLAKSRGEPIIGDDLPNLGHLSQALGDFFSKQLVALFASKRRGATDINAIQLPT